MVVATLVVGACSRPTAPQQQALPALPRLNVAGSQERIRKQLQEAYNQAQAKPEDPDANGRLGMVYHVFQQFESAGVCYRRARIFDPNRARWAYYLGLAEAALARNEAAEAALREAVRLQPEYVPARMKLAEVLFTQNRWPESQEIYEAVAREHPQFVPVYYWLGRVEAAQGHPEASLAHYRKACESWPSYGTAHYALGLAYQKAGNEAKAREHFSAYERNRLGDPQPEDPLWDAVQALDNTALAHLMNGVNLAALGQMEQAIAEHERATELDPKMAQAHANLIGLCARVGRAEDAERHYRATVAINPNLPQSHYDFGVLRLNQGRHAEAERSFRKALEINPVYADAHHNLGVVLEREGKLDQAMRCYQAALQNMPNLRLAHFHLGRLLLLRRRNDEAIQQFSQALTPEDAETPRFMYALGTAYAKIGNVPHAVRQLREARQRAASLGQTQLAANIEGDLRRLEQGHR